MERCDGRTVSGTVWSLGRILTVEIESLGACPAPAASLVPPKRFPLRLRPGKKVTLRYAVTLDCANDAEPSAAGAAHDDFVVAARVDRAALDGFRDLYPRDDVAPRSAAGRVPGSRRAIRDRGAGRPTATARRGGPVVIDVVASPSAR